MKCPNCEQELGSREYEAKVADHSFEVVKFILTLYSTGLVLFLTITGLYLAFKASELGQSKDWDGVKWLFYFVSASMIGMTWLFESIIRKAMTRYQRYMLLLSGRQADQSIETGISKLVSFGRIVGFSVSAVIVAAMIALYAY